MVDKAPAIAAGRTRHDRALRRRAAEAGPGRGIRLERLGWLVRGRHRHLVDVAGRRTLPANEFIKRFDAEADSKNPQMDFVFFLDGREKEGKVVDSDAAALRASWKRLKWDIAQK